MRIEKVSIQKFRSIKESNFIMDSITAIVGENNAGKTTILRALNSVFNFKEEEKYFRNKTHQYAKRSVTYIEVYLADIPVGFFQDGHSVHKIGIKFSYSYSKCKRKLMLIKNGKEEFISNIDEFMKKLSNYIQFVYISSERTNIDISWGQETLCQRRVNFFHLATG